MKRQTAVGHDHEDTLLRAVCLFVTVAAHNLLFKSGSAHLSLQFAAFLFFIFCFGGALLAGTIFYVAFASSFLLS